jgi:hypothetical protein
MSHTLEAAHQIEQSSAISLVLRTRALLLSARSAIAVLCEGIREGVIAYRKYTELRAGGTAHADAIKSVLVDSARIRRGTTHLK